MSDDGLGLAMSLHYAELAGKKVTEIARKNEESIAALSARVTELETLLGRLFDSNPNEGLVELMRVDASVILAGRETTHDAA